MRLLLLIILVVCLSVQALAFNRDSNWIRHGRARKNEIIDFHVALYQKNLDILESTLLDVSNPLSSNYGKYWDKDSVLNLVAPEKNVVDKVEDYLYGNGVNSIEVHSDFMKVSASVSIVEKLFSVEMYNYKHATKKNRKLIRSKQSYSIPTQIKDHVHIITGLSELPHLNNGPKQSKLNINPNPTSSPVPSIDQGLVVPATIINLYGMPTGFNNHPNSSICLVEFNDDGSFNPQDLEEFSNNSGIPPVKVSKIIGKYTPTNPDSESTLDVQYGGSISQGAEVWFWTVNGWMYEFSSSLAESSEAPYVVSMSWGWPEPHQCDKGFGKCPDGESSYDYVERTNIEFQKIGLRGITLLAASGDEGAPGDSNYNCDPKSKTPITAIFPGASPWVTSVGATMLEESSSNGGNIYEDVPICKSEQCANSTIEIACQHPPAQITSGGGFSIYSPRPSWQSEVVEAYLNSGVEFPNSKYFNSSNRGFPDVSALGHNFYMQFTGAEEPVDGTSASSPVFGAIITLLNSDRLNNNKSPLGFINPLLYSAAAASNYNAFNDIISGNNKCTSFCCSDNGFFATTGWDAVTGLGTPNFKGLLAYTRNLQ